MIPYKAKLRPIPIHKRDVIKHQSNASNAETHRRRLFGIDVVVKVEKNINIRNGNGFDRTQREQIKNEKKTITKYRRTREKTVYLRKKDTNLIWNSLVNLETAYKHLLKHYETSKHCNIALNGKENTDTAAPKDQLISLQKAIKTMMNTRLLNIFINRRYHHIHKSKQKRTYHESQKRSTKTRHQRPHGKKNSKLYKNWTSEIPQPKKGKNNKKNYGNQ